MQNKIITQVTLHVDASNYNRPNCIYAKQYDANTRFLKIRIVGHNGGIPVSGTAQLNATKPDGTRSFTKGEINDDGTITVELTSQLLAVDGKVSCDVTIFDAPEDEGGKEILTTSTFFILVDKSNYNSDAIESMNEFSTISDALTKIGKAEDYAREAEAAQGLAKAAQVAAEEAQSEAEKASADAEKSAKEADDNAKATAESEENAKNSSISATSSAERAEEAKSTAVEEALNAKTHAESASLAKDAAEAAAENAKNEVVKAQGEVRLAFDEAERAKDEANTAAKHSTNAQKASEEAAESAESAAQSADIAKENTANIKKQCANALRGKLLGAVVRADDVSPIEHELEVKVSSKNLFKTTNYSKGSLSNGAISSYQQFAITSDYIFLPKGNYIISYIKGAVGVDGVHLRTIAVYDKDKNYIESLWSQRLNNYKFTLDGDRYVRIDLEKSAPDGGLGTNSYPIENYDTFLTDYKVQLESGTTATVYTPYVDVEGTKVTRLGKNFFDSDTEKLVTPDYTDKWGYLIKLPAGTYTMHAEGTATSDYIYGSFYDDNGNLLLGEDGRRVAVDIVTHNIMPIKKFEVIEGYSLFLYDPVNVIKNEAIAQFSKFNIQIEMGNTSTPFEPYIKPVEAVVDAEGNVELMSLAPSMTLTTDNAGAIIECTYNRDTNKVIENLINAIISLGGNI